MSTPAAEPARAPESCDLAVVGGGILGLAVARELLRRNPRASLCVLERETELGRHQTGHNSGVIHAGIYYQPGSLKARLCVTGARELYEYCEQWGIASERRGKLIVATDASELPRLQELERRGRANGVAGLRRLDAAGIEEIEPHARGIAALHSPGTGTVDFRAVAHGYAREVLEAGGALATGCEVEDVAPARRRLRLAHSQGTTEAGHAVFCAGLWADLHLTRDIHGEVLIGPTALLAGARDAYRLSTLRRADLLDTLSWPGTWRMLARWFTTGVSELRHTLLRSAFVRAAARYVPELRSADVEPSFAGVRAQALGRDGRLIDDFLFSATERALHVRNAPSPAATSSLAIARYVADEAERAFGLETRSR